MSTLGCICIRPAILESTGQLLPGSVDARCPLHRARPQTRRKRSKRDVKRDALLAELRRVIGWQKAGSDKEADHDYADKALLAYINDPEVAEAYNAIEKWYA